MNTKKLIALLLLFIACNSFAQISEKQVDELVENTLKSFNVPGIAVAIVKDGKVVQQSVGVVPKASILNMIAAH